MSDASISTAEKGSHSSAASATTTHRLARHWPGLRLLVRKIHLYVSLSFGSFLVLAGLSGSVLAFRTEIDKMLNPQLLCVEPSEHRIGIAQAIAAANAAAPDNTSIVAVYLPRQPDDAYVLRYGAPQTGHRGSGHHRRLWEVMVDPRDGRVLGSRDRDRALVPWLLRLHAHLLDGDIGTVIMGTTALLTLFLSATGIYLWWPKRWTYAQTVGVKTSAGWRRLNFDLHKTVGILGAVILFAIAAAGVSFNLPTVFKTAIGAFTPVTPNLPDPKSRKQASKTLEPDAILDRAQNVFPDALPQALNYPKDADGSFQVSFRQPGEVRERGASRVWIDPADGEILLVRNPLNFSTGDRIVNLQLPIHNGEILGLPGRITVAITGFVPLILMLTGLTLWISKRSGHRKSRVGRD